MIQYKRGDVMYRLTREENVFLAKRLLVDSIWKSAQMDGINITFPETQVIYDQGILQNISMDIVEKVLNLKHAWKVLLDTIDEEPSLEYISKLHYEVARGEALVWGKLRTGKVGISGTSWIPPIPDEKEIRQKLEAFESEPASEDTIIARLLWMMRSQLFWDGNKRTAFLLANKEMIRYGFGLFSVAEERLQEFHKKLSDYYTSGHGNDLKSFLMEYCVVGIDYEKEENCMEE